MKLCILPESCESAAVNMALDAWMLTQVDSGRPVWFRHYGWTHSAFTFGYPQRYEEVSAFVKGIEATGVELCRRPTGGGIVDHRNDWTYALALHKDTDWASLPPLELYGCLHQWLAEALCEVHAPQVKLFEPDVWETAPKACFERPSPYDLLDAESGMKVAGAALKRTRSGVLVQGSLSRERLAGCDFTRLGDCLMEVLQRQPFLTKEGVRVVAPPDSIPGVDVFASRSWLVRR